MKNLTDKIAQQFILMCNTGKLFKSNIPGSKIWEIYLKSFDSGKDLIFRDPESTEHNCNNCHNFIRRYGNIIALDKDYNIMSLFDVKLEKDNEYYAPMKAMSKLLKDSKIEDVFFETYKELNFLPYEVVKKTNKKFRLGIAENHKIYTKEEAEVYENTVKIGQVYTFNHFFLDLPKEFVDFSNDSIGTILGEFRDNKNVFQRGMEEIPLDTLELVIDLILQGSLLNGDTYLSKVKEFLKLKKEYNNTSDSLKDSWCWVASQRIKFPKFKNELIGVLCSDLAQGIDLNKACQDWNKREDPSNKLKPTAPITKKQIEEAKKFVEENGYSESFDRRYATIDDINISEIIHSNVGDGKIKTASIFDSVKPSSPTRHKKSEFDKVEEVNIEKFMSDILPSAKSVEVYFENRMENNLVTITTSKNKDTKSIFSWTNNFSWTYNGNLSGKSELTKMVEAKGGRIDGAFRFTHSWNKLERNESLMDLHVFMPGCEIPINFHHGPKVKGRRVGWNLRNDTLSGGTQDVDYIDQAPIGYIPVENITFPNINKMPEGVYTCAINNWNFRGSGGKGEAEIALGGNVYQYIYPATKNNEWIIIAEVTLKNGRFSIEHKLPLVSETSKELWGLETNNFHKVNLVSLSPNHWGDNKVGHKHYFFMLDKCHSDEPMRSFHNENLISDLLKHRKVLDILGNTTKLDPAKKQLAGIGFNATVRDKLIVRVKGSHQRMLKIKI